MRKTALLTVILLFAVLLCSCTLTLTDEGGRLVDKKNGVTYLGAPICFEPIRLGEDKYAVCKKPKLELYPIEGLDTSLWLSEPFEGIGGVWYADSITLPTLSEFNATTAYICVEQTITVSLGIITEKADIDAIVSAFVDGEPTSIVTSGESYKLKFSSDDYPGIYYNLLYIEGDDGENYIYDRQNKRCVNVGKAVEKYLPR